MNETNWQTRAAAWELAALSFRYPDTELVEALSTGEWAEAAREIVAALDITLPDGFGTDITADALRPEATRLFVGAPEPVCSPYEGVWAAHADGVQALLFVNPRSMEVERFVHSCGLGRPENTNEPFDHVATECELLEHLALRAAGAEPDAGAPADADLPGGSSAAAYDTFFVEHARTWMPAFAASVAAEARHPFYRDAAAYLGVLVG